MSTIFTKIANGEIPSYKVAESEDFYAFLDIAPMAKGHTLVIPKKAKPILQEEEQKTTEKIDKKKLILYSEIMKPKYTE